MSGPVGVLVIGAGDMGLRHARGWRAAGAAVRAVADPQLERARAVAAEVGGDAFDDADGVDAALARSDVQVVSVATPTFLHADTTVRALRAGKHVLCEKPVALELADAERMAAAERESDGELWIGFMRRFDPAFAQLRSAVARVGAPLLAQATLSAGIRPKLLMHDARGNGGPIIDMCCHVFDQWVALFGERPVNVRAAGYTFGEGKLELAGIERKAVDSASITLDYPSGGVGQIQVSWGLPRGIPHAERHTYLGPDGYVSADWPHEVRFSDEHGSTEWTPAGADPWSEQIAHLHRRLQGAEHRPLATLAEGTEALRTSLAVLRAIRERREVRIPEHEPDAPDARIGRTAGSAP